jgi:hypothetical protein
MESVVGVFDSLRDAERSVHAMRRSGIAENRINLLIPGESAVDQPGLSIENEQPGIGKAVGGVVGGATGAVAGISIAASLMLPGVGLVTAAGVAAAAVLTVAGAIGGGAVGQALDENLDGHIPVDELYVYQDALRKGRTVVIVFAADDDQRNLIRRLFAQDGAESIDAAREQRSVGLSDAAAAHYEAAEAEDNPLGTAAGKDRR